MPRFCGECGKEYKLIGPRDKHMRKAHNINPYSEKGLRLGIQFTDLEWDHIKSNPECICCDFKPSNWYGLQNHVTKTHNMRMGAYLVKLRKKLDSEKVQGSKLNLHQEKEK